MKVRELFVCAAAIGLVSCSTVDGTASTKTYVLVHGAFQTAAAFEPLATELRSEGHEVTVVKMPGMDNPDPVQFGDYVGKINAVLDPSKPAILVGHSFGGITSTLAALEEPDAITKLVYLAAYIPEPGKSMELMAYEDSESKFTEKEFLISPDYTEANVLVSARTMLFCNDCNAEEKALATSIYREEPLAPIGTKTDFDPSALNGLSRAYIRALDDNAISIQFQDKMIEKAGIVQVETLKSGHSPHISKTRQLAKMLSKM